MSSTLVVRVGANTKAFEREMQKIAPALTKLGSDLTSIGTTMTNKVTKPLLGVATAAVFVGANFDSKMSIVRAATGATSTEMEKLEGAAREMGRTSVFGANQTAEAMEAMGLAGWDATQIYEALPGVVNLAASAKLGLDSATSIVTNGLTAFGMEADEAGRFVDVLATANKNANIDVAGLGEALKYVGSTAGAMGYDIEDVTLAIGLMANGGMSASQAGTSLRAALSELANPSKRAAEELDGLGVSMFDAEGEAKPLQTVLNDLRGGLEGMSTEQQNAALSTIFGTTALTGMQHVINASDEDFKSLINNLENAEGNASKFADIMEDNLKGELSLLKSSLEEVSIALSRTLIPAIRRGVERITDLVNIFNDLDPAQQRNIVKFGAFVAAIGPVLKVGGTLLTFVAKLKTGFLLASGAKGVGAMNVALGSKGLGASVGKGLGSIAKLSGGILGIKALPFVAIGASIAGIGYVVHQSFQQDAIPSVDDLSESIASLEGASSDVADKVSEETQNIVESFAGMHIGAMTEIKALGSSANVATETQMEGMNSKITDMVDFNISELERRRDEALETIREQHEREGILTQAEIDERVEEASIGWDRRIAEQETKRDEMLEKLGDSFDDEGVVVDTHYNDLLEMLGTFQEDSMALHVTDNEAREIMMDTWRETEEGQQQLHYVRLLEMAREHHYDLIEQLEGATAREQAELESHYMSQEAMTSEHYIGINREMGRQHSDQLQEIGHYFADAGKTMERAYELGETLTRDWHQDLLSELQRHHAEAGTTNSRAFDDDLALLEGHFSSYNDMTEQEYELFQKLINSAHENTRKDAREEFNGQRSDLEKHYREGNELTSEQMGLMSRHINSEHERQQTDLETALTDQLNEYKDSYSDISRAIDIETGKQYGYWQYRQLLIEEGMGSIASTWNALRFNRHRATVETEEISLSPLSFPGQNANGTPNWRGGLTWVNERGPELINLPGGSSVIPAPLSSLMAQGFGRSVGENIRAQEPSNHPREEQPAPLLVMDGQVVARLLNPYSDNISRTKLNMTTRGVLL